MAGKFRGKIAVIGHEPKIATLGGEPAIRPLVDTCENVVGYYAQDEVPFLAPRKIPSGVPCPSILSPPDSDTPLAQLIYECNKMT